MILPYLVLIILQFVNFYKVSINIIIISEIPHFFTTVSILTQEKHATNNVILSFFYFITKNTVLKGKGCILCWLFSFE